MEKSYLVYHIKMNAKVKQITKKQLDVIISWNFTKQFLRKQKIFPLN